MFEFAGTKERKTTQFIIIHCSATKEDQDIGAYEIDRWHRKRGWAGIGYHYVIRRDGTVEIGRPRNIRGAHCKRYNAISVGICLVGGVNADNVKLAENNFTQEQFDALEDLIEELRVYYPKAAIRGHRDMPNVSKACPSFEVKDWLKKLHYM